MRMSASMVRPALDKMPGGSETNHEPGDPKIIAKSPSRAPEGAYGSHHFEDSRGESMFYIAGGGEGRGKMPYRVSIRSPMFITIPYAAKCMMATKWPIFLRLWVHSIRVLEKPTGDLQWQEPAIG